MKQTPTTEPSAAKAPRAWVAGGSRTAAHWAIRAYQLTFSGLIGRQCRHLPTCSDYADEAITRYGLWIGGWMALARVCRCHPWGSAGIDPVPAAIDRGVRWYAPWRHGCWTTSAPRAGRER